MMERNRKILTKTETKKNNNLAKKRKRNQAQSSIQSKIQHGVLALAKK
jgi:hypothetical protein